jgi:hypothetical protein
MEGGTSVSSFDYRGLKRPPRLEQNDPTLWRVERTAETRRKGRVGALRR